jgi:hypothetical protein
VNPEHSAVELDTAGLLLGSTFPRCCVVVAVAVAAGLTVAAAATVVVAAATAAAFHVESPEACVAVHHSDVFVPPTLTAVVSHSMNLHWRKKHSELIAERKEKTLMTVILKSESDHKTDVG